MESKVCPRCATEFLPRRSWQRYCSPACRTYLAQKRYLKQHGFKK